MLAGRMFSHHNIPMVWASTVRVIFQREVRDEKEKQEGWLRVGRWVRVGSPLLSSSPRSRVQADHTSHPAYPIPVQVPRQATGAGMCRLENGCIVGADGIRI